MANYLPSCRISPTKSNDDYLVNLGEIPPTSWELSFDVQNADEANSHRLSNAPDLYSRRLS